VIGKNSLLGVSRSRLTIMTSYDIGLSARRRADGGCLADLACERPARYRVRIDVDTLIDADTPVDADTPKPVHRQADVCADHLDGVVEYLRGWAAEGDLPGGRLTVSAIDEPARA
jgi:hypothetical protein